MRVAVAGTTALRFDDGSPVRAASAVTAYDGGWLVVQDDATHACLLPADLGPGTRLRLLPPVAGHDGFAEDDGTKPLKPDLEAACPVHGGVLVLGSGSTPARMRGVLVTGARPVVGDLTPVYARAAAALGVDAAQLNLEGACVLGTVLRWFHRGRPAAGVPSAYVDLPLASLVDAVRGIVDPASVPLSGATALDLGDGLAVTDAVALGARSVLVSTAREDSPNAYDDGPVLASGLALLVDEVVVDRVRLPEVDGRVAKVEGLALRSVDRDRVRLLATVDADDPAVPSTALDLDLDLDPELRVVQRPL